MIKIGHKNKITNATQRVNQKNAVLKFMHLKLVACKVVQFQKIVINDEMSKENILN